MMPGWIFLASALYMTFLVALVISLLQEGLESGIFRHTVRRWGKFLLGLAILAIFVQILTWAS